MPVERMEEVEAVSRRVRQHALEQLEHLLRESGCRITKQRRILLGIILEGNCGCCKEIYYKATLEDPTIGFATVYRMVNKLEEIGAIDRKNMYRVLRSSTEESTQTCSILLSDHSTLYMTQNSLEQVIEAGLRSCGYIQEQRVLEVSAGKGQTQEPGRGEERRRMVTMLPESEQGLAVS